MTSISYHIISFTYKYYDSVATTTITTITTRNTIYIDNYKNNINNNKNRNTILYRVNEIENILLIKIQLISKKVKYLSSNLFHFFLFQQFLLKNFFMHNHSSKMCNSFHLGSISTRNRLFHGILFETRWTSFQVMPLLRRHNLKW